MTISTRSLRRLVLGAFGITVGAVSLGWWWARLVVPDTIAWTAVIAFVVFAAATSRLLRRARSDMVGLEGEVGKLHARLAAKRARIDEIATGQGRFVGSIAHELQTPLAIVLVELELLLRSCNDPAAVVSHGKSIIGDMRHLSDLVSSFLRLSRPFSQADTSHHVPVDVHDFVVEAAHSTQTLARSSGVGLVVHLAEPADGDEAPEVLGDAVLLESMLENLVRNAVRFSPRGARVELQVLAHIESVVLHVLDRGIGIPAENLETVFDWFFQVPGVTLQSGGTGFGLAIAKRVAEHHGGTIVLRNVAGGGCEFEITLPRYRPPAAASAADREAAAGPVA